MTIIDLTLLLRKIFLVRISSNKKNITAGRNAPLLLKRNNGIKIAEDIKKYE
tara:strand:+ start:767 stop:922 length:156 start_codon:yes stop_codon:yes gene_type:complete